MRHTRALLILATLFAFVGCGERRPDLEKPKSHLTGDLSFSYPGNWNITDESEEDGTRYIHMETTGSGNVVLQTFSPEFYESVLEYAKVYAESYNGEIKVGSATKSAFESLPEKKGYERVQETFDHSWLGETVPHQRIYANKIVGKERVILVFQAATEDMEKAMPGFDLIAKTLSYRPEE